MFGSTTKVCQHAQAVLQKHDRLEACHIELSSATDYENFAQRLLQAIHTLADACSELNVWGLIAELSLMINILHKPVRTSGFPTSWHGVWMACGQANRLTRCARCTSAIAAWGIPRDAIHRC